MEFNTMSRKLEIKFHSKENIKDVELNNILDKIHFKNELTKREIDFLDQFENIDENEIKDYNYLSLLDLFYIMSKIDKNIICDIKDKEGKISDLIISMEYVHDDCKIILGLKHGTFILTDNYLYKLVYEFKHDNYSLDTQDEYYEKINLEK